MADIVSDDPGKLIDGLFELLDTKNTALYKDVWKKYKNAMKEIIKKSKINENDIRKIIEYFDFVIENTFESTESLTFITRPPIPPRRRRRGVGKLEIYKRVIEIKKLILNYFIRNKNLDENAQIICHVNNINRWLLPEYNAYMAPPVTFKKVKDYEEQNNKWRKEIINLINMKKEERGENQNWDKIKELLDPNGRWRNDGVGPLPITGKLEEEEKRSMNYLNSLLDDEKVQIDPIKKCASSSSSIFKEEKKCVEIAEYDDQFCVKFTGKSCDEEVKKGGRKRKSKKRKKKSRKYLRRKRRESRRKELKRKSKKKLV